MVEPIEYQRGPVNRPAAPGLRWYGKTGLLLLSIGLLSLAFAPFDQFFLAWIGLVPMLVVIAHCRSAWSAFFWVWAAATAFFALNMWWLVFVTGPGMAALVVLLGMYWAVPAMLLRGSGILVAPGMAGATPPRSGRILGFGGRGGILPPRGGVARVLAMATVWVGFEWLRGTWPLQGLPWLFLGHTQSPALVICQIADVTGVAGVTFFVVMINALVALAILDRGFARLRGAAAAVLACIVATVVYGAFRYSQASADTRPGPSVLVVQTNIPQSNDGSKGATPDDYMQRHWDPTVAALRSGEKPDLVVWSETAVPPINPEARIFVGLEDFYQLLSGFSAHFHINLLTGGLRWRDFQKVGDDLVPQDRRNVTYLFNREGELAQSYDKVHLVPFGEYMPFEHSFPLLYRLLLKLNPYGSNSTYTLSSGDPDHLTAFAITDSTGHAWRFVTPICFEDIDGPLVRKMFAPAKGEPGKRGDFIVNVTNDGWFRGGENAQHLQASIFRAIENRAPIARSVNTGISGFVDSMGRTSDLVPVRTDGTAIEQLRIDSRTTLYTRWGDWFAWLCAILTGGLLVICLGLWAAGKIGRRAVQQGE